MFIHLHCTWYLCEYKLLFLFLGYKVILTLLTGTTTFLVSDTLMFRLPKPDVAYSLGVQAVNNVGSGELVFAVNSELENEQKY